MKKIKKIQEKFWRPKNISSKIGEQKKISRKKIGEHKNFKNFFFASSKTTNWSSPQAARESAGSETKARAGGEQHRRRTERAGRRAEGDIGADY